MEDDLEDLVDALRAAFRGVQRGEITLHEAEVIDAYGTDKSRARARRVDTETCWEEIPDKDIEESTTALSHLDATSWRYYLPRYLQWSLGHFRTSRSISLGHTIYSLLFGQDKAINDDLRARYDTLTLEQSRTVARFLKFMSQNDQYVDGAAASEALQKYWKKFSD